ncbi:MAG: 2-oxoacid:acceptor oxidoreductase subunit alpha [Lewinellaceae bacterium]|nr:2-oxoacid:acceptor oxidoreductase subunit alpha [Saprospiraceae bacterium]MCB9345511.1 2-oxoacid:acceptor oxidoreductase subunit alpha [Lewinellaceae bacterium]
MNVINDFVIRFANVNGTGSASANEMFAKAIFRMGIPVSPKNIFPSNIQGLPTWYEVRVSEKGYLGRREGINIMLSVNPQSMSKDIANVKSGGYFIYDSTKELHKDMIRDDIHYLGIPMMQMCMDKFADPRQRQLLKNMVYVGALTALLDIELPVLHQIIQEKFKNKEKLVTANFEAVDMGRTYAMEHFTCPLKYRVERRDKVGDWIMIDGNSACGLGAVYAGATVLSWYPITPSTSLADAFGKYAKKYRIDPETGKNNFAIVQAEDELAAIGMVIGANWNGARSFTATSGPGVSLMSEFLGLAYFAEIPTVLIDVQRGGPSTGMPTRTQQSDVMIAAYASHGDTKQVLLFPSTPGECFEQTVLAFDLAEQLQTPVLVMTDLDLGMNENMSPPLKWDDSKVYERGKVLDAKQLEDIEYYGRYLDTDGDGIPYRTIPGTHPTKGSFFTRGTSRDEYAVYTEEAPAYVRNMDRLMKKWETAKEYVPGPEFYQEEKQSNIGMIFFGTTTYAAMEAKELLEARDIQIDAMRVKAFPFNESVKEFIDSHDRIFVVEQNRDGQLRSLLISEFVMNSNKLVSVLNYDGFPITADLIRQKIYENLIGKLDPGFIEHEIAEPTDTDISE